MKELRYGLIVSDFDGTLIDEKGKINENTKEQIALYRQNGGIFAISTGRMPDAVLKNAKELGLNGLLSCCQGALILDIETETLLFKGAIPNATAIKVCKKLEELGLHIHAYDVWEYYSNKDDEPLKIYEKITDTRAVRVLDKPLSRFLEETGLDVCKLLAMVEPERNASLIETLQKERFDGCVVTKSAEVLVEVLSEKYSKGTAVTFLAERYNIPLENVVCVGDQWNDIPMVEKAGLGVAVKNADEKLKEKADLVLKYSNGEGAVGKLIEEYAYIENIETENTED